jgi:hypothetical protein
VRTLCLAILTATLIIACQRNVTLSGSESGGLGLSRSEWEHLHGPSVGEDSSAVRYLLDGADVFLNFTKANAAANYVMLRYSGPNSVSMERARSLAKSLIPLDSLVRRTYRPSMGGIADSYVSSSLTRLNQDWEGEPAGSFIVWYSTENELVSGFTIRMGKGLARE